LTQAPWRPGWTDGAGGRILRAERVDATV